ncbi:MAG TPA: response regulator [Patescibacteria group bacterium]|nr:response regulator [Patescibacteria group bacterium]
MIVLTVDDEPAFTKAINDFIADIDPHAKVLMANTESEGWRIYSEFGNSIDLILMDGNLGSGITSVPLIERIKKSGFHGRIFGLTGADPRSSPLPGQMLRAGCLRILQKPVDYKEIEQVLQECPSVAIEATG